MISIISVDNLLGWNLSIPKYQRPYKWTTKNIKDLLEDISRAISDATQYENFKYRVGSIIVHENTNTFDIVDGQQRTVSLLLLRLYLDPEYDCPLLKTIFSGNETQKHLRENYSFIEDWFSLSDDATESAFLKAFSSILEVVIISVEELSEAFQLFDSQNTRGKPLDPHDLLKAYHLRAMRDYPYEMRHVVNEWERVSSNEIRDLFNYYLFPVRKWALKEKTPQFSAREIDLFKGVSESSHYTYAKRAKKAMPYFQLTESFIEGEDFFLMVLHYLNLRNDMMLELSSNYSFKLINELLGSSPYSSGFNYSRNLFFCVLLCYYDKFHNFDERAVKKLFTWAFMLRVDLENLGFDSINKYAVGEWVDRYSNAGVPMFSIISNSRIHTEISNIQLKVVRPDNSAAKPRWNHLYQTILKLNGISVEGKDDGQE